MAYQNSLTAVMMFRFLHQLIFRHGVELVLKFFLQQVLLMTPGRDLLS